MPVVTFGSNTGNTYGGDTDFRMTESDPTTAHGADDFINAGDYGGGDHISCGWKPNLADFITSLAGSDISINSLTLDFSSDSAISTTGIVVTFYPCLRDAIEAQASWTNYQTATPWATGGAQGSGTDRSATAVGTITVTAGSGYDSLSGAAFNAWLLACINDAAVNNGIVSDHGNIANAQAYWGSTEAADGLRPVMTLDYSIVGGSPTLTDVDTDESITSTQTNVVVTGANLGATQGASTLSIIQGSVTKAQTSIDSWSATSIQFDVQFDA